MNSRICLSPECHIYKVKTLCRREDFFRSHVIKKSTNDVIIVLKNIGLDIPFDDLGRFTILNIFTDLCKESVAKRILGDENND